MQPVIDFFDLLGFGLPGEVAADVMLGGQSLGDERSGIGSKACEKDTQIVDDLAAALQGQDVTGAWGDEFGWAAVIEHDRGKA